MNYNIKQISAKEMNEALIKAYYTLSREEFWEIRQLVARNEDYCFSTLDGSCYYYYDHFTENFVYFALEKKVQNIRGACEVLYELVCNGIPCIRINGLSGRYDILKKTMHLKVEESDPREKRDFYVWYIAHPEDVEKLKKRINR